MTDMNELADEVQPDATPVVAAEAEEQETETTEAPEAEQVEVQEQDPAPDPEEREKQKSRTREFIERLKAEKREAEKRAREAEKELERLKAEKPKREDFEDEADYLEARLDYRDTMNRRKAIESETEEARRRAEEARALAWRERLAEAKRELPDIEQVISDPSLPIPAHVAQILMDSDYGPQVAYKLARNPSLAAEIAQMSDREAARAIGRLEAEASPKPRKISSAPPPVETVTARTGASGFDPARASPEELARIFRETGR